MNVLGFNVRTSEAHLYHVHHIRAYWLHVQSKPIVRSQEAQIVSRSRKIASLKRAHRNQVASGKDVRPPWARPRTLAVMLAEERTLDISQKWQRMGEFRK